MSESSKQISKVTIWAAVANSAIAALKFITGVLGGSAALVADSVHSLTDLVSDLLVLLMVRFKAGKKLESIVTAIISIMLIVAGGELLAGAVQRINDFIETGTIATPSRFAMWVALVVIVVNELMFRWISSVGKKYGSTAVVANAWHHRTDALASIGTAVGVAASVLLGGKWALLDPAICACISILVINMGVKLFLPALNRLTGGFLSEKQ